MMEIGTPKGFFSFSSLGRRSKKEQFVEEIVYGYKGLKNKKGWIRNKKKRKKKKKNEKRKEKMRKEKKRMKMKGYPELTGQKKKRKKKKKEKMEPRKDFRRRKDK